MRFHFVSTAYFLAGVAVIVTGLHFLSTHQFVKIESNEEILERLGHREETNDFDNRIEEEHDLSFKINSLLDSVIEHEALRSDQFDQMINVLNMAKNSHSIDTLRIETMKSKIRLNHELWKKTSTTTTTTTTTKSTTPPPKKIEYKKIPVDKELAQMREEAEALVPVPTTASFMPIEVASGEFGDFLEKLNAKRKFMFNERIKLEQKKFTLAKNQAKSGADQKYRVILENRKTFDANYKPGKPPAIGAKYDAEKRQWAIIPKPTTIPVIQTTTENPMSEDSLRDIREKISIMNNEVAHGEHAITSGAVFDNVFAIQVHTRTDFTQFLLETIAKMPDLGAQRNLIVISHDAWKPEMNELTSNLGALGLEIPFVNIFFPKSVLFYKHEFPGASPEDCPAKVEYTGAIEMNCNNKDWFDTFNNYREPHIVNIKHHWWWKLNFINQFFNFDHLILLEEDHALSEDALHVMNLMNNYRIEQNVDLMALGHYKGNLKLGDSMTKTPANQISLEEWFSGAHNMAMSVSKRWVDDVISNAEDFCVYDDYNWDWTLFHISKEVITKQGSQPWKVLIPTLPRSQHMGITGCGVHHLQGGCNFNSIKETFTKDQGRLMTGANMFPQTMTVLPSKKKAPLITRNGGWGDLRDVLLCREYSKNALDIDMSWLQRL